MLMLNREKRLLRESKEVMGLRIGGCTLVTVYVGNVISRCQSSLAAAVHQQMRRAATKGTRMAPYLLLMSAASAATERNRLTV